MFEGTMLTPAKKRDHRPSDGEKVSPDTKIPRHKEEDHASNPENMAAALQASPESPSIETNSDMKEIKEMLELSKVKWLQFCPIIGKYNETSRHLKNR